MPTAWKFTTYHLGRLQYQICAYPTGSYSSITEECFQKISLVQSADVGEQAGWSWCKYFLAAARMSAVPPDSVLTLTLLHASCRVPRKHRRR